ncbi:MAG: TetR/AcrR family transcriptional regulator [Pseudobdellovibrionaceae bacterium]
MAEKKEKKRKSAVRKDEYHHGDLKRALIRAASELLEEVGYEGFTLRKCAAKAGVSPSAPAHHFKDAMGLLNSLAVEGFQALSVNLRTAYLKSPKDLANPCTAVAMEYLRFAKNNPALYKVMFGSKLDADNPDLKSAGGACFENVHLSVREMFPNKNREEINAISLRMWSSVHGLSMLLIDGRLNFLVGKDGFKSLSSLESAWLKTQVFQAF